MRILVLVGVVALLGCGGDEVAPVPRQDELTGAWTTPRGAGCAFAVTFDHSRYEAGVSCAADGQVNIDSETGMFTLSPSGRMNFYPETGACSLRPMTNGEYGGTTLQPRISLGAPQLVVLAPSASAPFPADAVVGCFASDGTFAPR